MVPSIQHIGITCKQQNEDVASFYENVFGMTEVNVTSLFGPRSGVYLSDGNVNLACLVGYPHLEFGKLHFGFQVDDIEEKFAAAEKFGGRVGDRERPTTRAAGAFAEASVLDPIGTSIDLAVDGWRQRSNAEGNGQPVIQHIGLTTGEKVEEVATFYKEVFGMVEVNVTSLFAPRSGIYLSDGKINLACLMSPRHPVGRLHFGFKVDDIEERFAVAQQFGGKVGDRERPITRAAGAFAEASVLDPIGTSVDLAVEGWRIVPGGPPHAKK